VSAALTTALPDFYFYLEDAIDLLRDEVTWKITVIIAIIYIVGI
jgi:hypothetical protein